MMPALWVSGERKGLHVLDSDAAREDDMNGKRLLISFSGGETSALMTKLVLENMRDEYSEIRVVFANTGQENEETLEFVQRCDDAFGFGVVWIEARPSRGKGEPVREVNFNSASRDGSPFEDAIKIYGLPGPGWLHCTRELKTRPIARWALDNGWTEYDVAIGIRADEIDRMMYKARENGIIYPMVSRFPHTKPKVNEFWQRQTFRLDLKGYEGNCRWCWKKSLRKHLTIIKETPEAYDFPERMEAEYASAGNSKDGSERRLFRENRTVADLRRMAATTKFVPASDDAREYQTDLLDWLDADFDACGYGESCEVDFSEVE